MRILPFEYRVTKYDPRHRDDHGHYRRDEWTSASDIGRRFESGVLTIEEYLRVERDYLSTLAACAAAAGCAALTVTDREARDLRDPVLRAGVEGARLPMPAVLEVARGVLREQLWCRLEDEDRFFAHFGWDYYLYLGSATPIEQVAGAHGLFAEAMVSPYHRDGER
ncbi:hypothetical protein [Nocardia sp. NPDC050435]|uniref:hypothetical protein n=1 Tax=Nocardia sp. NPDC050435 TaxID=3155040 RepID=UPI0033EE1708